jgi:uncharacterized damage-inducible protein DinB
MVKAGLLGPPFNCSRAVPNCQPAQIGGITMSATLVESLREALVAEIENLRDEINEAAKCLSDAQLWKRPLPGSNSVGHLILHLTGNLNHFVGAQLGKTGYTRDREREFTESVAPARAVLMQRLDDAVGVFRKVVSGLTEPQLTTPHPYEKFGSVVNALVHLVAHFALHRGQISYIRRLV